MNLSIYYNCFENGKEKEWKEKRKRDAEMGKRERNREGEMREREKKRDMSGPFET